MSDQIRELAEIDLDIELERKRPRLLALLFCDFSSLAKDDKANLLGIFDRIYVDKEKPITPTFVAFVRVAEVTNSFDITMIAPDNSRVFSIKLQVPPVDFTKSLPRQAQAAQLLQFEVQQEGVYWVDVSYEGKSLGGGGLTIEFRRTEEKEGGTDTYR
jgi:hypothetical protein